MEGSCVNSLVLRSLPVLEFNSCRSPLLWIQLLSLFLSVVATPPELKCPAGQYARPRALDAELFCVECIGGFYCLGGTTPIKACPRGKYSTGDQKGCLLCSKDYYQAHPGKSSCEPCPAGKFNPELGGTDCRGCEAGRYSTRAATDHSCTSIPRHA